MYAKHGQSHRVKRVTMSWDGMEVEGIGWACVTVAHDKERESTKTWAHEMIDCQGRWALYLDTHA